MRDTVSGAIAIPKASWGCAPALPNLLQLVFLGIMFHVKQCSQGNQFFTSGKRGFHPCFCLPACCNCPVALSEFTTLILIVQSCLNLTASKNAIAAGKTCCKYNLLRKCGLLAHTSAAFLKNCCTEKLFIRLRLVFYNQYQKIILIIFYCAL